MHTTFKLFLISVFMLSLSGFLILQGIKPEFNNFNTPPTNSPSPSPSVEQVLGEQTASPSASLENKYHVTKVVDGDTIKVQYGPKEETVRFIGVNTPETVDPRKPVQCFGKEASNETKRLLTDKDVVLQKDVSERDKFGRLLRFVYLPLDDGSTLFVNDYLVREGFAQVDTFPPDVKLADRFVAAQKEAVDNNRGLWNKCK